MNVENDSIRLWNWTLDGTMWLISLWNMLYRSPPPPNYINILQYAHITSRSVIMLTTKTGLKIFFQKIRCYTINIVLLLSAYVTPSMQRFNIWRHVLATNGGATIYAISTGMTLKTGCVSQHSNMCRWLPCVRCHAT